MSRPLPRSSRRSLLGGIATAAGLAGATGLGAGGCTASEGPPGTPSSRRSPRATGSPRAGDAEDPDAVLVTLLVGEVSRTHAQVLANRVAHPELSDVLRRLERLHARHAVELGGLVEVAPAVPERRRNRVLDRLASTEARLQRRLVADAVAAESGALALLVAGMAAGLAQERSLL